MELWFSGVELEKSIDVTFIGSFYCCHITFTRPVCRGFVSSDVFKTFDSFDLLPFFMIFGTFVPTSESINSEREKKVGNQF